MNSPTPARAPARAMPTPPPASATGADATPGPRDAINPMGTQGYAFVEFTAPDRDGIESLHRLFTLMGFTAVARHRSKDVVLFRQGEINFLVNATPYSHFAQFAQVHGPSACAMGWKVDDAVAAYHHALANGAVPFHHQPGFMELHLPAVYGIGNSVIYFTDERTGQTVFDADFVFFDGVEKFPKGVGLTTLDHLTHNVLRGNMDVWSGFYTRIANFRQIRYFDIEGKQTGLFSKAMTSPCGNIRIPINESADEHSQIEEFLKQYRGEGIQHLALSTDDIYATVEALRARGVVFMTTPDTYYERVDARLPEHGEDVARLQKLHVLIDGAPVEGILLQIFTSTVIGPIFFEIIQRKGNEGFGEGNFRALFESIEEDQMRRGVLPAKADA